MSQQLKIKKRRAPGRTGSGQRRGALRLFTEPSLALAGSGLALPAPRLVMYEPEGIRSTLVTGSVTALVHLAGLLALVLMAMLAPPELIEKIIPVEILHEVTPVELPGSDLEPAPSGPKSVGTLRPSAAAMATSQALSPEQAAALRQAALEAARRAMQQMQLEAQQGIQLPTQLDRREVHADSLAAHAAAAETPVTPVDARNIEAVRIDPRDLAALQIDTSGPREIDTSNLGDLSAPEAFAILSELGTPEYTGAVSASDLEAARTIGVGAGAGGSGVDIGASTGYSGGGGPGDATGGGGSGGTGTAPGVARCMESASVVRYIEKLEERTIQRWHVPDNVPSDVRVILRFRLDAAGMVSDIEVPGDQNEILANSAQRALRSAAPFPPMKGDIRCMANKQLISTFDVPSR